MPVPFSPLTLWIAMTTIQFVGFFWFASAIFIAVIQNVVFVFWLKKLGVRLIFGLAGTPGYLDYVYFNWCKSQGRSPKRILILRALCLANAIFAAIVVMPMIISANDK
jgi:hypothetical protein